MASKKECKIDVVKVDLRYAKGATVELKFDELLLHQHVNDQEFDIKGKIVHFSVKENNDDYLIGFVRSIIDKDLPPKINKKSKEMASLGLKGDEGLAYGNVMLYCKKQEVLFYEKNKNSIYLDWFYEFIYMCYRKSSLLKDNGAFDLTFPIIFTKNEYERALKFHKLKKLKIIVHQPGKLLSEYKKINSSLPKKMNLMIENQLEEADKIRSEFATIEFAVTDAKKGPGLNKSKVHEILSSVLKLTHYQETGDNIKTLEVCGYETDESTRMSPIDLIGNVFKTSFTLDVPRLDVDCNVTQRISKIKDVYKKEYPKLADYI